MSEPAFPFYCGDDVFNHGMSKRFYAACCAMQGLLANGLSAEIRKKYPDKGDDGLYAWSAFDLADALIEEEGERIKAEGESDENNR